MKRELKMQDFWMYVTQFQEEIREEVLNQVTEDEYFPCIQAINDYMFYLRAMYLDRIWAMNSSKNKYIKLINEALARRNIFINECYIHISNL